MISQLNNRIYSYYNEALQILKGEIPIPRMALFMPSNACNQRCSYCFYSADNNGFVMKKEHAFKVIKELADFGIKSIDFCGGGEPLTTPYAIELIGEIIVRKLNFGIISNGVFFCDKSMEITVKHGTYCRVTVDTVNRELYKKIRGTNDIDKVIVNLIKSIEYKKKIKSGIDISIKLGMHDYETMNESIEFFKDWDLSNIQIKRTRNLDGVINQDLFQGIISEGTTKANTYIYRKPKNTIPCWLTPLHTVIDAHGDVYLCCYYQNRKKTHCIGNVLKTSFKNIWGNERHKEALAGINHEECLKFDCKFHGHNKVMKDVLDTRGLLKFI